MTWGSRLVALLSAIVLAYSGEAKADNGCQGIPNCVLQKQSPINFGASDTKGWAFYCTGQQPYFWGVEFADDFERWEQGNNCFTTTENPYAESAPNKLDVTITNWCLKDEDYSISIACSPNPPPNWAPTCGSSNPGAPIYKDPGCPIKGNIKNTCNGLQTQFCMQTWQEQCTNNIQYYCTLDIYLGLTTCVGCTE